MRNSVAVRFYLLSVQTFLVPFQPGKVGDKKRPWEDSIMRKMVLVSLLIAMTACERFPTNPSKTPPSPEIVFVEHAGTDYVPANPPLEGIVATKVNILTFNVRAENFQPKALEFCIKAEVEGPPDAKDHMILFRTDQVTFSPDETGYTFDTLEQIHPDTIYTLYRPKYPTNEYSPFDGDQGKILSIQIIEVWAIDEEGAKYSVAFEDSL
jgi:hypothetical protein